ncbi:hypothetical protein KGF57_004283 [Candida theae]|uniref:Uncharacterized protein n=1 Tax=Candida theae TaxID=1198502 RepID=A0AAD5FX43_9ASCO|nr:uncharacterized protein KGF57_004283 [Candida theae]KAI5950677.1 hypothetical protein KGF57_004283 [Candida theae]
MRLTLDLYQLDILQRVFSFVEVKEITQLLNEHFLSHNPSIKIAIHRRLERGFGYFHKTSRNYGDENNYPDSRSQDRNALNREQYEMVDAYCVNKQIHTTSKISYGLCHMVDLLDLVELIKALQSSNTASLMFELDFSYKFTIDMNKFMKSFDHISDRVVELSMGLKRLHILEGDICFRNLEVFSSHMCGVSGSFKCPKLKELVFNALGGVEVGKLPPVKRLEFACTKWLRKEEMVSSWDGPEGLRIIRLQGGFVNCIDRTFMKEILEYACPNTMIDCIGKLYGDVIALLFSALQEKRCILRSLSVDYLIHQFYPPCYSLHLSGVQDMLVLQNMPATLKVLEISNLHVYGISAKYLLNLMPEGLESLTLLENYSIEWEEILDLLRFRMLRKVALSSAVHSIKTAFFPDLLKELSFCNCGWQTNQFTFPKNLICMRLGGIGGLHGAMTDFDMSQFPSTLKQVELRDNKIVTIDLSNVKKLQNLSLCRTEFEGLKLPQVDSLSVEHCQKIPESYCGGVEQYLCFRQCNLENMTLKLGCGLKYLVLSRCNISKFGVDLPGCLEEVDLSHNNLTEFPAQLSSLKRLRLLNIADNRIQNGHIDFQTCSIEALDISCNLIEEIKLTFPGPTKLMYLALHDNKMKEISNESIGSHPRLFKVELDENGCNVINNVKLPNAADQDYFEEWEISGAIKRE